MLVAGFPGSWTFVWLDTFGYHLHLWCYLCGCRAAPRTVPNSCVTDVRMHEVKLFKCLSSLRKNLPQFPCTNTTKCRKLMQGTCTIIARILHILQVGFSWVPCMQYTSYIPVIPLLPLYHAVIPPSDTSIYQWYSTSIPVIPLYQRYHWYIGIAEVLLV